MTDADKPICDAMGALSDTDMELAARQTLDDAGMEGSRSSEEVKAIARSLAWAVAAVRDLPTNMLMGAATSDGGRGLRDEVFYLPTASTRNSGSSFSWIANRISTLAR